MARGSLLGLMWCLFFCGVTAEGVSVTVKEGDDAFLGCSISKNIRDTSDITVEWRRNHQEIPYVLLFRDGRLDCKRQDPQFKNRAAVADPELKNGNLSLILRNAISSDNGIYECLFEGETPRQRRDVGPVTSVHLIVTKRPGTWTKDTTRLGLVLTVGFVVFAVIAAVLYVRVFPKFRTRQIDKKPTEIPAESVSLSVGQNKSSVCAPLVSNSDLQRSAPVLRNSLTSSVMVSSESCHLTAVEGFMSSSLTTSPQNPQKTTKDERTSLTKSNSLQTWFKPQFRPGFGLV